MPKHSQCATVPKPHYIHDNKDVTIKGSFSSSLSEAAVDPEVSTGLLDLGQCFFLLKK